MSDEDLIHHVKHLAACEREATSRLVASLAEVDVRRLYLGQGCASLFTYCTQVLHLSEQAAYLRIQAARLAQRLPLTLVRLASGELTLTTMVLLAPHLTEANQQALLDEARCQGRRAVEEIVARFRPRPDVPASVRKLPSRLCGNGDTSLGRHAINQTVAAPAPAGPRPTAATTTLGAQSPLEDPSPSLPDLLHLEPPTASASLPASACSAAVPRRPASVRPLAPARYHLQVTISTETRDKLRRAQDLLRHAVPDGDPAEVLDRALTLLIDRLQRDRAKKTPRPKTASRASVVPLAGADPVVRRPSHPTDEAHADERVRASAPMSVTDDLVSPEKAAAALHEPVGSPGRASSPSSRHRRSVQAATVREVWQRDEGRCTFVGAEGRCRETGFLELHHLVPVAWGGPSTEANVTLRCRPHNQGDAIRDFGVDAVVNGRDATRRRKETAGSTLFEPS